MSADWKLEALCQYFPELPWIAEPGQATRAAELAMSTVCAACAVRLECEVYVERCHVVSGFWAGQDRTPRTDLSRSGGAA